MKKSPIGNLLSQYGESVKCVLAALVYDRKESFLIEEISNINLEHSQLHVNYRYISELIKNLRFY
ncbi:MAG: hypothetical protein JSV62_09915 [Promethearchaeota archaeon]|nr:MAG: hypothetical protein JSV62_09915 [Candidatus Lokiarchaeota archaeon]